MCGLLLYDLINRFSADNRALSMTWALRLTLYFDFLTRQHDFPGTLCTLSFCDDIRALLLDSFAIESHVFVIGLQLWIHRKTWHWINGWNIFLSDEKLYEATEFKFDLLSIVIPLTRYEKLSILTLCRILHNSSTTATCLYRMNTIATLYIGNLKRRWWKH